MRCGLQIRQFKGLNVRESKVKIMCFLHTPGSDFCDSLLAVKRMSQYTYYAASFVTFVFHKVKRHIYGVMGCLNELVGKIYH